MKLSTNLRFTCAFAATLVARKHLKLDIQNSFAVFKTAPLSVNGGEGAMRQSVRFNWIQEVRIKTCIIDQGSRSELCSVDR